MHIILITLTDGFHKTYIFIIIYFFFLIAFFIFIHLISVRLKNILCNWSFLYFNDMQLKWCSL